MFKKNSNFVFSRAIVSACIGNFFEFYNFTAYGFFAPMIAKAFFPHQSSLTSLIYSLMIFSVGFLMRPIGAILFGRYLSHLGHKVTLLITFLLMALGTALIAVTPPAVDIGIAAPAIIIIARALQGISDGGEVGPATELIFVEAPTGSGGIYSTLQYITQLLGALAAVLIGIILSLCLAEPDLYSWGWRVPFVIGLCIAPVGLFLRQSGISHDVCDDIPRLDSGDHLVLRKVTPPIVIGILAFTITNYMRQFGVSYAIDILNLSPLTGLIGMATGLTFGIIGHIVGMFIFVRLVNPRPFMATIGIINALLSLPLYWFSINRPGLISQITLNIAMYFLGGIVNVAFSKVVIESLPKNSRAFVFGLLYAITVSTFGGMTQPAVAWLINCTNNPLVPGYIALCAIPIGVLAWLRLLELNKYNIVKLQ